MLKLDHQVHLVGKHGDGLRANGCRFSGDITLSQICEALENADLAFDGMFDFSLDGYANFSVGMDTGHELVVKLEMQP